MADRWNVRERLQTAKERLRDYEGVLKELERRRKVLRGQADQATGTAKVQFRRAEKDVRAAIQTTLTRLDATLKTVEPHARRALEDTKLIARGLQAGVRAGAAKYRETSRRK